ncbi:glutathione-disulfide reductase [bacterium]|nr:glutathione-disulfide reductase [bacterium]
MAQYDYDLVVIGAGSGGVGLARRAALYGAKVAICEARPVYGGTCVHRGCVPKKLMVYASSLRSELALLPGYGYQAVDPVFDWSQLIANQDKELARLDGVYRKLLDNSQVDRIDGQACLVDGHTVRVGERNVTGKYLAVATGARPWIPERPGAELALTSDDLFHLKQLPKSITLMGSGYIGLEFACIFAGLGSEVTVMFRSSLPLPDFDGDVRKTLKEQMEVKGIRFVTGAHLDKLTGQPGDIEVHTNVGSWKSEVFVAATGRVPNTEGIGLVEAGLKLGEQGEILTDEHCRTSLDSVFALGDCVGGVQLTPYAIAQGRALAARLFQDPNADFRPHHIPTAVFTQPAIGTVGLTQEQAEESNPGDVDVYRTSFRPMKYTLPDKPEKVMMKLVVRRSNQLVLGCHMVGSDAPEIIQALAVALTCGASKQDFDRTLAIHPTAAEEFVLLRDPVK